MKTLGIDLSTDPRKTAAAMIEWPESGPGRLTLVRTPAEDEDLVELIEAADVAGIDAPLGWPEPFVYTLTAWHQGGAWSEVSSTDLQQRTTDSFVSDKLTTLARERGVRPPNRPMSVSADRIGATAMRAARVLTRTAQSGKIKAKHLDRSGAPPSRVAEVYPAAALFTWDLPSTGYKGSLGEDSRRDLVRQLNRELADIAATDAVARGLMRRNDDALDAVICALITRAVAVGATYLPEASDETRVAKSEGWIHIPKGPLSDLLG